MPGHGPDPYDINFCFPVRELENERVKLTPFIPSQHADLFFQGSCTSPDFYQYLPFGPYASSRAFTKDLIEGRIQPDPGMMLYAIIDKTRSSPPPLPSITSIAGSESTSHGYGTTVPPTTPELSSATFAGTIGYLYGSPENLSLEIGFVMILPPFRRTHVTTHAVGLLMCYALDAPGASESPGLGLRRIQWQTSNMNGASVRVAERMGFRMEARLRWDRVFPCGRGKVGEEGVREGDARPGTLGRHTAMLAICWDDWENGGKEMVSRLMDR